MRFAPALLIALVAAPMPAMAMTGAELLKMPPLFGTGYVWGAIESASDVPYDEGTARLFQHRNRCLVDAKVSSGTAYDATVALIKNDASLLAKPAVVGVSAFLQKVCGPLPE